MALGNDLGSLFDFDPGIYSAMEGLLAGVACVWVFWGLKKVEGLGEPEVGGGSSLNRGSVQSLVVDKAHSCFPPCCWSPCGAWHPDPGEATLVLSPAGCFILQNGSYERMLTFLPGSGFLCSYELM